MTAIKSEHIDDPWSDTVTFGIRLAEFRHSQVTLAEIHDDHLYIFQGSKAKVKLTLETAAKVFPKFKEFLEQNGKR